MHPGKLAFPKREKARVNSKEQIQLLGQTASKPRTTAKKKIFLPVIWVYNCQTSRSSKISGFHQIEKPIKATVIYMIKLLIYIYKVISNVIIIKRGNRTNMFVNFMAQHLIFLNTLWFAWNYIDSWS